jgi:carboxylesterase type B
MNAPIVEITSGKIQGTQEEGLQVFRGIPFAQPPL